MAYFPLFVDLEGKDVLVVGGGTVACRRIQALADFGCRIYVVSPALCEELCILYKEETLVWQKKCYDKEDLNGNPNGNRPVFVLTAAGKETDRQVAEDCKKMGIPVNNASDKGLCDFYFPGLAGKGELVVGVTASGTDHKKAAELTAAIRRFIQETY